VDLNGSVGDNHVRDESLYALLRRVADELLPQQPRHPFGAGGNEKWQTFLIADGDVQVARSRQDVPIHLEGRSVFLRRACQRATVSAQR